jgi:hypothetical protein
MTERRRKHVAICHKGCSTREIGQQATSHRMGSMSVLHPKADIDHDGSNVRFVPIADSCGAAKLLDA